MRILRLFFIRTTIFAASLVVCFALVEFATRIFIVPDRLDITPRDAFLQNSNAANAALLPMWDPKCSWVERYRPSLRFGYLYKQKGECALEGVDKYGFLNQAPFPVERDPKIFSVLVVGGSVAEALAESRNKTNILQNAFRKKYFGPKAQEIRVYTGAIGAWAVPTQELVLLTFMERFDAVVSIDGANEVGRIRGESAVGTPNPIQFAIRYDHTTLFKIEFTIVKLMRSMGSAWPLKYSYAWAGAQSVLELATQEELFSNLDRDTDTGAHTNIFDEPGITREKVADRNIGRYIRHAKNIHAMSNANGLLSLHFIQPIAGIAKSLTPEEKGYDEFENKDYYRVLESRTLKELAGQPTYSLVDIFANERQWIYSDRVHLRFENGKSPGYEMLAEAIVDRAAKNWSLKKRGEDRPTK